MIVESIYGSKFALLNPFFEKIFSAIKKEIKREIGIRGSFLNRKLRIQTLKETKETVELLFKNITLPEEGELAEWIASSWINKHGDIFEFFHNRLIKISMNYDLLTELPSFEEESLFLESIGKFGPLNTYIFSVLNSVVFSAPKMEELRILAENESKNKEEISEKIPETSLEEIRKYFENRIQKLTEKQEKKILGITERYKTEIAGYRKQIGQLQKKIEDSVVKS